MPVDMKRYPENWTAISYKIRFERGQGQCECTGECGLHEGRCEAEHGKAHPITGALVWLTTAHLGIPLPDGTPGNKHDKMDVRLENLKGMCQRCHLSYDMAEHIENRAKSRYQGKIDNGQMELL